MNNTTSILKNIFCFTFIFFNLCYGAHVLTEQEFEDLVACSGITFVEVSAITHLLDDDTYFIVRDSDGSYAVAPLEYVESAVEDLPNDAIKKKLKNKAFCSVNVKNKATAYNLQVCNNATINNLTVSGTFNACGKNVCALLLTLSTLSTCTGTSLDIPNTLVLRDGTGSFAATTITLTGCLVLNDQLAETAATVCANTNALMVSPVAPRALQTTVAGDVRGASAVDLQMSRGTPSQVASGDYSVISGGQNNTAAAVYSVVGGGFSNTVSNPYSGVFTGADNTIEGSYAYIGAGQGNTISSGADYAVIGGGLNNTVTSTGAAILGGNNNKIADSFSSYASIVSGIGNTILTGTASIIVGGVYNTLLGAYSGLLSGSANTVNGAFCTISGGELNNVQGQYSAVVGGLANKVNNNALMSCIVCGQWNTVSNSLSIVLSGSGNTIASSGSTIGGGVNNQIYSTANNAGIFFGTSNSMLYGPVTNSVIASGENNTIAYSTNSIICSGLDNSIKGISSLITNSCNFIGAGQSNVISENASFSAIVSGSGNTVTSPFAVIGGGQNNKITGYYSMILGGQNNQANGDYAFASGTNAIATHTGSFVWADSNSGLFTSSRVNSFNVRASGGIYFATNAAGTVGLQVGPGGCTWNNLSSSRYKENAHPVDTLQTLSAVVQLPINTWNLITQDPSIIHIGPYAQDFFDAFGYGEDPEYINTMDAIGVLFASVQGLYTLYQHDNGSAVDNEMRDLEDRIRRLEALVDVDVKKKLKNKVYGSINVKKKLTARDIQVCNNAQFNNLQVCAELIVCGTNVCTFLNTIFSSTFRSSSEDIPLTLALRDDTGSFAATTITLTGCLVLTDQLSETAATICADTQALKVSPVAPRALQTTVDGDIRGQSAIDLQMSRELPAQIASGNYAAITGGQNNTASAALSIIGGGVSNTVSNVYSGIFTGVNNTVAGPSSAIGAGQGNSATSVAEYGYIGGGLNNSIGARQTTVLGGVHNTISQANSSSFGAIVSGLDNAISADTNSIIGAGEANVLSNNLCAILTGVGNSTISFDTVVGGSENVCRGVYDIIMNGISNFTGVSFSCIIAGLNNSITNVGSSAIGCGQHNSSTAGSGMIIMNGQYNIVGHSGGSGGIFCGINNFANAPNGVVLGGSTNNSTGFGSAVVCSGSANNNTTGGSNNFIGAGMYNTITSNQNSALIVTGSGNLLNGSPLYATILGGKNNSSSQTLTMAMGDSNHVTAINSLAFGSRAQATNTGSFIWSDTSAGNFSTSINNSFNARASGGFYLSVNPTGTYNLCLIYVPVGGSSWNCLCSSRYKENAHPVDALQALSAVAQLPINTWNLIAQDPSIIHIGPYAEDFFKTFRYGEDPDYINTMDAIGTLFASVKGLYQLRDTKKSVFVKNNDQRQRQILDLKGRIALLEYKMLL